jgi:hypothetical protein
MLVPTVEQAKPVQSVEHLSLMPEAVVVVVSTGMVQEEPVVVEMALARVEVTAAPELSIPALVVEEEPLLFLQIWAGLELLAKEMLVDLVPMVLDMFLVVAVGLEQQE